MTSISSKVEFCVDYLKKFSAYTNCMFITRTSLDCLHHEIFLVEMNVFVSHTVMSYNQCFQMRGQELGDTLNTEPNHLSFNKVPRNGHGSFQQTVLQAKCEVLTSCPTLLPTTGSHGNCVSITSLKYLRINTPRHNTILLGQDFW